MFFQVLAHSKPCLFYLIFHGFWHAFGYILAHIFKTCSRIVFVYLFDDALSCLLDASGMPLGKFSTPWPPLGCLWAPILSCKTWLNRSLRPLKLLCHFWGLSGSPWDTSGLVLDALDPFGPALGSHFELICHGIHVFFTSIFRTWWFRRGYNRQALCDDPQWFWWCIKIILSHCASFLSSQCNTINVL